MCFRDQTSCRYQICVNSNYELEIEGAPAELYLFALFVEFRAKQLLRAVVTFLFLQNLLLFNEDIN